MAWLRLPVLGDVFCDPDLGTPAYTSRLWLEGRCPYTDAVITKPPGSVMIYAAVFRLIGMRMLYIHLLALAATCATAAFLFFFVRRRGFFGAAAATATLYAFYQAELLFSGVCPNFEFWSILPAVAALFVLTRPRGSPVVHALAAGALTTLGVWMKQTAVFFVFAAALLTLLVAWRDRRDRGPRAWLDLGWFGLGAIAASLPFVVAMAAVSCLTPMAAQLAPWRMGTYLASFNAAERWAMASEQFKLLFDSNLYLMLALGASLVLLSVFKRLRVVAAELEWPAVIIFLLAAIASALAGGRFYGHYFIVVFPFICLIVGLMVKGLFAAAPRVVLGLVLVALAVGTALDSAPELKLARLSTLGFVTDGTARSARVFDENREHTIQPDWDPFLLNHLEWQDIFRQVGDYMHARLKPGETIWSFDYIPEIYYYARAFSATRHQENFEIVTESNNPGYGLWFSSANDAVRRNRDVLMRELTAHPPRFIIRYTYKCPFPAPSVLRNEPEWPRNVFDHPVTYCQQKLETFDALQNLLDTRYAKVTPPVTNAIDIYELRPENPPPAATEP